MGDNGRVCEPSMHFFSEDERIRLAGKSLLRAWRTGGRRPDQIEAGASTRAAIGQLAQAESIFNGVAQSAIEIDHGGVRPQHL